MHSRACARSRVVLITCYASGGLLLHCLTCMREPNVFVLCLSLQVAKQAESPVPDIANLFETFDFTKLSDQVNRSVQAILNRFWSQHVAEGATVPELSVRAIVERLKGMNGAVCWTLAGQMTHQATATVEQMTMKQIRYEAMPAKCAEKITEVLAKMPKSATSRLHASSSTSGELVDCLNVQQTSEWLRLHGISADVIAACAKVEAIGSDLVAWSQDHYVRFMKLRLGAAMHLYEVVHSTGNSA
eukprot:m.224421 g.224421  ORF g.224421 m.224421 type:complete len:244 (+) comp17288_c0_seq2:3029-3760(+)